MLRSLICNFEKLLQIVKFILFKSSYSTDSDLIMFLIFNLLDGNETTKEDERPTKTKHANEFSAGVQLPFLTQHSSLTFTSGPFLFRKTNYRE